MSLDETASPRGRWILACLVLALGVAAAEPPVPSVPAAVAAAPAAESAELTPQELETLRAAAATLAEGLLAPPIRRLHSARFTVQADLTHDENVRRISGNLEATFDVLDAVFGVEGPKEPTPSIPVYVYRSRGSFSKLAVLLEVEEEGAGRGEAEEEGELAGFYSPALNILAFCLEAESNQSFAQTMIHEATHAYLDTHVMPTEVTPVWLSEGFAEYVGTSAISEGKLILGTVPREQRYHLGGFSMNVPSNAYLSLDLLRHSLRYEGRPNLRELLAMDEERFYAEDGLVNYAAAWMFVHCLRHEGPDAEPRFLALIAALRDGKDSVEALRSSYGEPADLGPRFRRYVKRFGNY